MNTTTTKNQCPNCKIEMVETEKGYKCLNCIYSITSKIEKPKKVNKHIELVNEQIKEMLVLAELGDGLAPWQKSYSILRRRNYTSNRLYNGINRILLSGDPEISYITEKDIKKRGLELKEEATGRFVVAWIPPKRLTEKEKNDLKNQGYSDFDIEKKDKKRFPMMISFIVYMAKDVIGLPKKGYADDRANIPAADCEKWIDKIIKEKGLKIEIGGNQPNFKPFQDCITVPRIEQYKDSDSYYRDLFHEIAHWTGLQNRLNRWTPEKFDIKEYGKEELIAEIASCYMSHLFNIPVIEESISYLEGWRKVIEEDPYIYVSAAQRAEKILEYLGITD